MTERLECGYLRSPKGGACKCGSGKAPCACAPHIGLPPVSRLISADQRDTQDKRVKKIQEKLSDKSAAFVLGAGVSIPAGLPNWVSLISKMMGHAIQYYNIAKAGEGSWRDPELIRLTNALIKGDMSFLSGINTLESAEYVAQFFDDSSLPHSMRRQRSELAMKEMLKRMMDDSLTAEELLAKELLKQLKGGFPDKGLDPPFSGIPEGTAKKLIGLKKWTKQELSRAYDEIKPYVGSLSKPDLRAAAKLNTTFAAAYLMAHEKGIRSMMTYNYDPLIEEYMTDFFEVDKSNVCVHSEEWNHETGGAAEVREIFHVHGFVPGRRSCSVFCPESEHLILSEDSYYEVEQSGAYNWSSSVQSHFLSKYNCIFVGFSAEDYNFKRILRQQGQNEDYGDDESEDKKGYHYLIFSIDGLVRNTYKDVCRYHMQRGTGGSGISFTPDIEADTKLMLQQILLSKEKYWRRFRILPVWATVKDIPDLLVGLLPS